ncbi:hypothetical protein U8D42_27180 (plasmid) [Mycobacterium europaeum]|uniref:PknH-like extracellular domain-containing protein n=3 Tax=Mycobacterium TaxID=1763 RepID=A0A1X0JUA9_MYCSC|nr:MULTISPECIES: hypothetical protein [Mycobacterium]ASL12318.1 hypothetical protein MYCODSM44623_05644 [Mycobacterium intracellulare subsp. chimaera]ASL18263.1 hypothetical protein MYCOZU2_05918 [Mycobacterium intracellulare subsp. chimaera]KLO30633.1 hypothetical protein ABW17_29300 [Mycobacterium nebraskense]MCV7116564.1 hypothetical protein [Mycobacterium nebraskense]MCV7325708.1 hypothetical protein [Mycobacterium intracellulare subsp. chimaera]
MKVRALTLILAVAAAAITVACSTTIAGSAIKAPGEASSDGVDLALLDVGNFPTAPRPPIGVASDALQGGWAEGRRLASAVVGPWEVDPDLIDFAQMESGVVKDTDAVNSLLGAPLGEALNGHHLLAGFSSARHTDKGAYKDLLNMVLELASPADATAAIADMAAKGASLTMPFDTKPVPTQPVSIPRYPATTALSYTWTAHYPEPGGPRFTVTALSAHGQYVLAQAATSADNADRAAQLIATTLDVQQPLVDQFKPTPPDQMAQLPLDPDGLMARTVAPRQENESISDGVYDAHGALHLAPDDPVHLAALFKSAAVQQVAWVVETRIYQTPDSGSAARLVADMTGPNQVRGISGMPKAKCFNETLAYWCVARADRYAYEMQNEQEHALHQMMAAQYRMLTGK